MASLSEIYVKKSTLETILKVLNAKQGKDAEGVKLTISLSDHLSAKSRHTKTCNYTPISN